MEINEISTFIEYEEKRLEDYYKEKDKNEITMAMGFKVIEEIGDYLIKYWQTKDIKEKKN